ncbi:MAG: radical SAM family heme chaperone HemW [Planctomycetaceae bacterium]|nr:radical SAM family heme chaperone HemW [Planctomycetaceae bacterium]
MPEPRETSSIGLYLHIPFCVRKCPYCGFYSEPLASRDPEPVIDAMFMELERYAIAEPVETIYVGGGSPTCLPSQLLIEIVVSLLSQFKNVCEFTIECNPAQVSLELLKDLFALGVNRLSIGAQSFNDDELCRLGRIHNARQISEAVKLARQAGFANVSLDLIFATPGSTLESWQDSLRQAIALNPTHISAYSLTLEKKTPFEQAFACGQLELPGESAERQMHQLARRMLNEAGFHHYEISNFARPGFECLHNMRYWKNRPVVGIGPAAASWYKGRRTGNVAEIAEYVQTIEAGRFAYKEEQTPTPEQIARETAILNLRTLEGIDLAGFERQTGFNALDLFKEAIATHTASGLLEQTPTHLRLTEKGLSFADTVACDFA